MRTSSVLTTLGVMAAAMALTTSVASAASPKAPHVANTNQKISLQLKSNGSYRATKSIDYATTTFTVPAYGDSGTFKNTGRKLTMKITRAGKGDGDKDCRFTATYDPSTTDYVGNYTCPGGVKNKFLVTTASS